MTIFYCGRRETAVDWEVKIADFVVLLGKDAKKVPGTNGTVMCFSQLAHNVTNRTTVFLCIIER